MLVGTHDNLVICAQLPRPKTLGGNARTHEQTPYLRSGNSYSTIMGGPESDKRGVWTTGWSRACKLHASPEMLSTRALNKFVHKLLVFGQETSET